MEVVTAEARATDMLEILDDGGRAMRWTRRGFGLVGRQLAESVAVTVRSGAGDLCLVVGLWPDEDAEGVAEAWLGVGPGLAQRLKASLKAARTALETVGAEARPLLVRAYIHPDSVAGPRLAAWFGFEAAGVTDSRLGPLQTFERRFS